MEETKNNGNAALVTPLSRRELDHVESRNPPRYEILNGKFVNLANEPPHTKPRAVNPVGWRQQHCVSDNLATPPVVPENQLKEYIENRQKAQNAAANNPAPAVQNNGMDYEQIAKDTWNGKYGNGNERYNAWRKKFGSNFDVKAMQEYVNAYGKRMRATTNNNAAATTAAAAATGAPAAASNNNAPDDDGYGTWLQNMQEYYKEHGKRIGSERDKQISAWQKVYEDVLKERDSLPKANMDAGKRKRLEGMLTTIISAIGNLIDAGAVSGRGLAPVRDFRGQVNAANAQAAALDASEQAKEHGARKEWMDKLLKHYDKYPQFKEGDPLGNMYKMELEMRKDNLHRKLQAQQHKENMEQKDKDRTSRERIAAKNRAAQEQKDKDKDNDYAVLQGHGGARIHIPLRMLKNGSDVATYSSLLNIAETMKDKNGNPVIPADRMRKIREEFQGDFDANQVNKIRVGRILMDYPQFLQELQKYGLKVIYPAGTAAGTHTPAANPAPQKENVPQVNFPYPYQPVPQVNFPYPYQPVPQQQNRVPYKPNYQPAAPAKSGTAQKPAAAPAKSGTAQKPAPTGKTGKRLNLEL